MSWKTEIDIRELKAAVLKLAEGLGEKLKAAEAEIAELRAEVERLQSWRQRTAPGIQQAIRSTRVWR